MSQKTKKFGLIVVSAPSGAGKSTLCAQLLKKYKNRLALSISTTSRMPRGKEQHGVEYFFCSAEEFKNKIDQNLFAEWALVHENYYGTSRKTLESFWSSNKHVLLDIDVQGAESLRRVYPDQSLLVFIAPPGLDVLEKRLRGRGTETEAVIQKRMKNAIDEMARMNEFDQVIVNDVFENAFQELEKTVLHFMDSLEGDTWQKRP